MIMSEVMGLKVGSQNSNYVQQLITRSAATGKVEFYQIEYEDQGGNGNG